MSHNIDLFSVLLNILPGFTFGKFVLN